MIDGSAEENDDLLAEWPFFDGVPVYHLHESLERLLKLTRSYSRIAIGSSGPYSSTCTLSWWVRMGAIMTLLCDENRPPIVKLHGLRMFAPAIVEHIPLTSADSGMVARNVNRDPQMEWNLCTSHKSGAGHNSAGPH